ncbi:reducing type I polyketide synthase [Zopfia rhizophila CBS 207.26]|uniref:Reducing type I polyketide synthase n=1 Tax=Zopfia rhizophila CBS 207.26 TaxID=1314779 RepID=A0A6A6EGQ8_9PEZI|nr:reducing type I polyketide synthase [Zopfia rhizophila CBS 207.26]
MAPHATSPTRANSYIPQVSPRTNGVHAANGTNGSTDGASPVQEKEKSSPPEVPPKSPSLRSNSSASTNGSPRAEASHDPNAIAIVGMSFKFPGGTDTEESFWKMLVEGRCAATEFPEDRLSASNLYHPAPNRRGTIPFRGAHFIEGDISKFDAPFFSISDTEAASLDPMQRILLETTFRALENAGQPLERVTGSNTSVYTGCFTNDWQHLSLKDSEPSSNHTALGIEASINANRISWFFNLKGTSFNVDSACSSSLVSLDLACKGLVSGDADMSIAAGCNLIFFPDIMHALSNYGLLSPDNRCYSFDSRGNGYARGEGFCVLILKRLSDALASNDVIRAVIRSTGSNSDGYTPGISQPNGKAQAALIRSSYEKAGLPLDDTMFFEAHGTGTATGDPIEANAIGSVFRNSRSVEYPLYVGAVKSNIGHLEGASGIAGIIKTVLALERGIVPPNANFKSVNPRIDTEFLRVKFPQEPTIWPRKGLRRASVNSFGFGGTNAHAILDDALHYLRKRGLAGNHHTVEYPALESAFDIPRALTNGITNDATSEPKLLILSAAGSTSLKVQAQVYSTFFKSQEASVQLPSYINSLAYTLNTRRSPLAWKSFAVITSPSDLLNLESRLSSAQRSTSNPSLGLIFTGQGAQYPGSMIRTLEAYPTFARSLSNAEACLLDLGCAWRLRAELYASSETTHINKAEYAQPISTAVQVALVDLMKSLGVYPKVVLGHSSGEIAAAYCAGAISATSAWKIAYFRGLHSTVLARSDEENGAMLAVGLSAKDVQPHVDSVGNVVIACINSSKNVTISGKNDSINRLERILSDQGVFARKLKVDMAYHSPAMNAAAREYSKSLGKLKPGVRSPHRITMVSTVTGKWISEDQLCSPQYWVNNMVSPVKFSEALGGLDFGTGRKIWKKLDRSHRNHEKATFLMEVGFHGALRGYVRDILNDAGSTGNIGYASVLTRGQSPVKTLRESLGQLYCHGYALNLHTLNQLDEHPRLLADLPEYQFNHSKSYWEEGRISKRIRLHPQGKLDLLGKPSPDWNLLEAKWRNFIRVSEMEWVEDHRINGALIYPAAGMLVMAIEAANQMADANRLVEGFDLKDVTFLKTLNVPTDANGVETHLYLRQMPDSSSSAIPWSEFRVCSFENNDWQENCRGFIRVQYSKTLSSLNGEKESEQALDRCWSQNASFTPLNSSPFDSTQLYETLRACGFGFGPSFQRLQNGVLKPGSEAKAELSLYEWPASSYPQPHIIHPCTLDAMIHLSAAVSCEGGNISMPTSVPSSLRKLWISKAGLSHFEASSVTASTRITREDSRGNDVDISVLDSSSSRILAQFEDMRFIVVSEASQSAPDASSQKQICYHLEYQPDLGPMDIHQLEKYCSQARFQESEPIDFYQDLTAVLVAFLSRAIKQVPNYNTSNLPPHLQKYIEWAHMTLDKFRFGELPNGRPDWELLQHDDTFFEQTCRRVESFNEFGRVYVAVGRALNSILRGHTDALDFLFGNQLLPTLYREINDNRTCFPEFNRYLEAYGHKNPSMRILEIGAGTGATTHKILSTLSQNGKPRYASYHYTDISPSFFEQAREEFKKYPDMQYQVLDIGADPLAQDFEASSFDFIVAANVLHVCDDIHRTMRYVRSLLKPGGILMMYEITRPDVLRTSFITGLLPGWWLGAEPERSWGAALHSKAWDTILKENGFSGIDVELPDFHTPECREASLVITTAATEAAESSSKVVIVADRRSAFQEDVALRLQSQISGDHASDCRVLGLEDAFLVEAPQDFYFIFIQELQLPFSHDLSKTAYAMLQCILSSSKGVVWVNGSGGEAPSHPEFGIVNGLLRTIRNEHPGRPCAMLGLDLKHGFAERQLQSICKVFNVIQASEDASLEDMEYLEVDGCLTVPRVIQDKDLTEDIYQRSLSKQESVRAIKDCPPVILTIGSPGFLDTLHFAEDEEIQQPLEAEKVEIEVRAIGVNFKDCLIALGRVPAKAFGGECAGIVTRIGSAVEYDLKLGDRVVMGTDKTFKTFARGNASSVLKIEDDMSFAEAASIPAQFCTAWESVHNLARLRKGESILIHAGAGGTGQAAIQVAQYIGATVYATVGSEMKKQVLMKEYGIPGDHIFYSRDTSFAKGIMQATNGRGVDVILNSLAGDSLVASWECIAAYGRFIEIGKKDVLSNSNLPMYSFRKNASFIAFDGSIWQIERPESAREAMQDVFNLFAQKKFHVVRPLHILGVDEVEKAFRSLQDGKMAGKMVLEMNPDTKVRTILPTQPSFTVNGNATYLIAGGFGGLGRIVSRWLFDRGARHFILLSRSGPKNEEARKLVQDLRSGGAVVVAEPCDVTDRAGISAILDCAKNMPPVRGCIQGSIVLRDAYFEKMSYDDWRTGTDCKTIGSWNLHELLPRNLDFFIMLSSASGIVGLRGQSNYAAGNNYMDALARYRVARGERAVSIDLGALTEDGILAENPELLNRVLAYGALNGISREQFFAILDYYSNPSLPVLPPKTSQPIFGIGDSAGPGLDGIVLSRQAIFRHLNEEAEQDASKSQSGTEDQKDWKQVFAACKSYPDAAAIISQALIHKLQRTLSTLQGDIDMERPLASYGVDSLLSVELRGWIAREFMADVAVFEISGASSFATLSGTVASRSKIKHEEWTG